MAETYEADVLILSETWLNGNDVENIVLHNYNHANYFVRKKHIHGGVSIFVNKNLKFKRCKNIDSFSYEYHCELASVEIKLNQCTLVIIAMYRTGKGNFEIFKEVISKLFNELCKVSQKKNHRIIFAGDWNVDFMLDSTRKHDINNIIKPNGFRNIVTFPTRIENTSKTSIECVVTNMADEDIIAKPLIVDIGSDHDAQMALLKIRKDVVPKFIHIQKRIYNSYAMHQFCEAMLSYDWDQIFDKYNSETFKNFFNKFLWNLDLYFPVKNCRVKNTQKCPWITEDLIKLQINIQDLYQLQRLHPQLMPSKESIREKSKIRDQCMQIKKKEYVENRLKRAKNPKKEVWSIIKEETNKNVKEWVWELLDDTTKNRIKLDKIPDHINYHFKTIGSDLQKNNCPNCEQAISNLIPTRQTDFAFRNISANDLIKIASKKLNLSHTKDLFDISGNFLYNIILQLTDHITYLINNILNSTEYPDALKKARITPLYKGKGEVTSVQNYRPITIVPSMSKIIESIIADDIMRHMHVHGIITDAQFAYRKGRSTTTATLKLVETVLNCLDNKKKVAGVFLDLSKAFDSVNHELLIKKLMTYGIKGQPLELLKSFLKDRQQTVQVRIDRKTLSSTPQTIDIGIPQGSSLGNVLFLVFLNDLPNLNIKGELIQYADDTSVIISADTSLDLEEAIRETMKVLSEWFKINGLKLNTQKTNIMYFNAVSPKVNTLTITLQDGTTCNTSNYVKLLGFELDPCLTWKQHIDSLCKKMSKAIYALKQLKHITTAENLKDVYYAYVHSILSYGLILWGSSTDYERVLKLQKRAIRVLVGGKYRETCREHFKILQIMTSVSQYIYDILKYVKNHPHMYKMQVCQKNKRTVRRIQGIYLEEPHHRLNMLTKLPLITGQKLFNKLPEWIKALTNNNEFLDNVKKLLLDKTLYTITEYMENDYSNLKP